MYLLRFDDLCPTMHWAIWPEIEALLTARRLRPILAVVPDNRDPALQAGPPAADFWTRAREWQARGWTIGLHGFQHKRLTCHPGIVTGRKAGEFAGLPAAEQERKLRSGVEILQRQGIKPQVWIAPRNAFDATTVSLLPRFGIQVVCDGYFRFPFVCPQKLAWVPQQLFGFRPAPAGVWTVCYHHNHWTAATLRDFQDDLDRYGDQIGSLEAALADLSPSRGRWSARLYNKPRLSRLVIRTQLKVWEWRMKVRSPMSESAVVRPV